MKYTTNELADKLGIDRDDAYTLIRFLEARQLIKRDGHLEPAQKRRGKKQYAYEIPSHTMTNVEALLKEHGS